MTNPSSANRNKEYPPQTVEKKRCNILIEREREREKEGQSVCECLFESTTRGRCLIIRKICVAMLCRHFIRNPFGGLKPIVYT